MGEVDCVELLIFLLGAPLHHPLPVPVVTCDPARFNSTEDNVGEGSWSIESHLAGHETYLGISASGIIALIPELFNPVNNMSPLRHFFGLLAETV